MNDGFQILKHREVHFYPRPGGASTAPLVTAGMGCESFISGYTDFPPAGEVEFHSHNCDESVVLMEGEGALQIDGASHEMKAGDASFIRAGKVHRFVNRSATAGMRILWIYASTAATRTMARDGATAPIALEHGVRRKTDA